MTGASKRIRAIAARLFTARTMARVVDPVLVDLRWEYDEARARGARWAARLTLVRGYAALARAVVWLAAAAAAQAVIDGSRSSAARTCLISALTSAIVTVLLVLAPLAQWPAWRDDPAFGVRLSVALIPQALPLSIPAGLCVAVLWALRGQTATWRRAGTVLAVALTLTTVVWVVLEWIMPHANQGFREMVAARLANGRAPVLEPGLNELGLSRLGQRTDPAAVRHYQILWALCFASAPLSLLASGLAPYVRRGTSAVALATALATAYFATLWVSAAGTSSPVPASLLAWTPNLLFLLIATALLVRAQAVSASQT
jgi:hypothetical protein